MEIHITSGVGTGSTKLAAFDAALGSAGVANYNLLRLSSVIPPKSQLTVHENGLEGIALPGGWGDRLYVVMADAYADAVGTEAWAGIGWVQDKVTGRGLFVEHVGKSESDVRRDIAQSLNDLTSTRGINLGPVQMKVSGCAYMDRPTCSLVVAVYQASDWQNAPLFFRN